jgi:hypothetical protein
MAPHPPDTLSHVMLEARGRQYGPHAWPHAWLYAEFASIAACIACMACKKVGVLPSCVLDWADKTTMKGGQAPGHELVDSCSNVALNQAYATTAPGEACDPRNQKAAQQYCFSHSHRRAFAVQPFANQGHTNIRKVI